MIKSTIAALAVIVSAASLSALPSPAPDDNNLADYAIRSVTPENCSLVDELSTITILYDYPDGGWSPAIRDDYAPDLWNPENPYKKLVVTRNGKTVSTLSVDKCFTSYGPTTLNLEFSLDTPQTADGIYEIVIPDRYIVDGANYATGKKTLRYQIGDGVGVDPGPEEPSTGFFRLESMTPAPGEITPELTFISAQWLDSNDEPCGWAGPDYLLLKSKNAEGEEFTVGKVNVDAGNGRIFFTPTRAYSAYGTVYLHIPAGAVTSADGSEKNEDEILLDFPIYYEGSINMNSTYPAAYGKINGSDGESMESIAIFYAQNMTVGSGDMPYLIDESGEIIDADDVLIPDMDKTQGLIQFDGADLLPKGRYSVVIPRGTFSNCRGVTFYYDFTPIPGQSIPDVPDDVKLTFTKCFIDDYDMLDPDNGIPALRIGAMLRMETNLDYASDVYWYKIIDVTDCKSDLEYDRAPAVHTSYIDKSGGFVAEILAPGGVVRKLTSDRLYVVQVHAYLNYYNAAMRRDWGYAYSAVFRGGSEPYEYADCEMTVVPEPGSALTAGQNIELTFDRPVNFESQNSGIPQGQEGTLGLTAVSNADKTRWTFTLPSEAFNDSNVEIHFGFTDAATGRRVRPEIYNVPETETIYHAIFNYGSEGQSQIVVIYGSFESKPEFSVEPESGSRVESLSEFTYKFADGDEIMPAWMGEAVVKDETGRIVATLLTDGMEADGGHVRADFDNPSLSDAKSIALHIPLDKAVKEPGVYTVEYPYGFFSKGREQQSDFTRPMTHIYEVTGNGTVGISGVSTDISDRVTVINLQGMVLLRDAAPESIRLLPAGIYIINGSKVRLK
ncbi:MAG: hypothetical protein K2M31_02520 [Muribaculaceae bacterium]|nr:hypothetical protein [Muribaculaceae bacterium]